MATRRRYLVMSAQQIDPLSWFTGPYLPLVFSGLVFVYGVGTTVFNWGATDNPSLQFAALALCALAGLLIYLRARALQAPIGWVTGAAALAISLAGFSLSAFGYAGTDVTLGVWWGTAAPALTLVSLAPYVTVRRLLILGIATTCLATVIGYMILYPIDPTVGPVFTAIAIGYPTATAVAATTTFSYSIVSTMLPLLESPSRMTVVGQQARDEAAADAEKANLARLTARAAPFLAAIADTGRVTPEDRALAGQLARRLRDDLVTQSSVSWLSSIADESRLVVVDPDRLSQRMNHAQRTALRGLLGAILQLPEADNSSLMIDLRKAADGATAVGVSIDMALPEGRRIMHIAPYYLTLKTTVDDLSVTRDGITFRIAAQGDRER